MNIKYISIIIVSILICLYGCNMVFAQEHDGSFPSIDSDEEQILDDESSDGSIGDPVYVTTGNWDHIETDISFKVFGKPFQFIRTYNSKYLENRSFGYGWSHNFDMHLLMNADGSITAIDEYGIWYRFQKKKHTSSYIPPKGLFSTLTESTDGTFVLTKKNGDQLQFDQNGKLAAITDRNNNRIVLQYNAEGLLEKIIDPVGRKIQLTYNSQGKIITLRDPVGRVVQYRYDDQQNLIKVINLAGHEQTYAYNHRHHLTKLTTYNGDEYQYFYRWDGKLLKNDDPRGVAEYFSYPTILGLFKRDKTIYRDRNGNTWTYFYEDDKVVKKIDSTGNVEKTWERDEYGNTTRVVFPDKTQIRYQYDERGNLTKVIDQSGHETTYTYEEKFNRRTSTTDALGQTTLYHYDQHGNLIERVDPLGGKTEYTYDSRGLLTSRTGEYDSTMTVAYDYNLQGDLLAIHYPNRGNQIEREALGRTARYPYYSREIVASRTGENSNTITYEYDRQGNLLAIHYPIGSIRFTYDKLGNPLSYTDANGNTTMYTYNQFNRVTSVTNSLNETTKYSYDREGNLLSMTTPSGSTITFTYANGQISSMTDQLGRTTYFQYDSNGNLSQKTDALKRQTLYEYDQKGKLSKVTYPDGSFTEFGHSTRGYLTSITDTVNTRVLTTTIEYDAAGNIIRVTRPDGTQIIQEYDALNRLTRVTDTAFSPSRMIEYEYNSGGELLRLVENGQATVLEWKNGRITKIMYPDASSTVYVYNENGYLTQAQYGSGVFFYEYDATGRLTSMTYPNGSVFRFTNTNDSIAQITGTGGLSIRLTYDRENRISGIENVLVGKKMAFHYDDVGNRTQMLDNNQRTTTYSYDALNRLVSVTDPQQQTTRYAAPIPEAVIPTLNQILQAYNFNQRNRLNNMLAKPSPEVSIAALRFVYPELKYWTKIIQANTRWNNYVDEEYFDKRGFISLQSLNRY